MEGSARIEGAAASMHESYVDGHGHKVAKDAVFIVIIFDEAPDTGRSSRNPKTSNTSTNNIRLGDTPTNQIYRGTPRVTHEQDRITNERV